MTQEYLKRKLLLKHLNNVAQIFCISYSSSRPSLATSLGHRFMKFLNWIFLWYWMCALTRVGQHQEMVLTFSLFFSPEISNEDSQLHRDKRVYFPRFLQLPRTSAELFMVFLILYILTRAGNAIIVTAIQRPSLPHTHVLLSKCPVYIRDFLTLVIIPCRSEPVHIPEGCGTQLFLFSLLCHHQLPSVGSNGGSGRYVAICNPPHYSVIMNWRVCAMLAFSVSATGFSLTGSGCGYFQIALCKALIEHFFLMFDLCWTWPVLAPNHQWYPDLLISLLATTVLPHSSSSPISSSSPPSSRLPQLRAEEGLCHLRLPPHCGHCPLWLCLHCLLQAQSENEQGCGDQLISVTYTVITPLLNPAVYSLRNKEVQDTQQRVVSRNPFPKMRSLPK